MKVVFCYFHDRSWKWNHRLIIVLFATTWLVFLFTWAFWILILIFECLSIENRLTYCIFLWHISQPYLNIFIPATNLLNQFNNICCQMVLVVKGAHPRHLELYIDKVWYSSYKYWFELKLGNIIWLAFVFGYERLTSAGTYYPSNSKVLYCKPNGCHFQNFDQLQPGSETHTSLFAPLFPNFYSSDILSPRLSQNA